MYHRITILWSADIVAVGAERCNSLARIIPTTEV